MKWMRPEFVEIDMSAEIGGYQRDNDGPLGPEGPAPGPRVPARFADVATPAGPASAEA